MCCSYKAFTGALLFTASFFFWIHIYIIDRLLSHLLIWSLLPFCRFRWDWRNGWILLSSRGAWIPFWNVLRYPAVVEFARWSFGSSKYSPTHAPLDACSFVAVSKEWSFSISDCLFLSNIPNLGFNPIHSMGKAHTCISPRMYYSHIFFTGMLWRGYFKGRWIMWQVHRVVCLYKLDAPASILCSRLFKCGIHATTVKHLVCDTSLVKYPSIASRNLDRGLAVYNCWLSYSLSKELSFLSGFALSARRN